MWGVVSFIKANLQHMFQESALVLRKRIKPLWIPISGVPNGRALNINWICSKSTSCWCPSPTLGIRFCYFFIFQSGHLPKSNKFVIPFVSGNAVVEKGDLLPRAADSMKGFYSCWYLKGFGMLTSSRIHLCIKAKDIKVWKRAIR